MKLPALAIAACVAAGILAGERLARTSLHALPLCLILTASLLLAAFVCAAFRRLTIAWALSLLAWVALGAGTAQIELRAVPRDNVAQLAAAGSLDLDQPLRWRGRLRDDPLRLPWGTRYEVDLEQVESAGSWMPVSGGLRLDYYFDERAPRNSSAEPFRAGDRVEALARARMIRNFADPGAFDYRAFLARQGIFVTGTLRNMELLAHLPGPRPSLGDRIARLRGRLLDEVDAMFAESKSSGAVARAMLLGDRSFLDREEVEPFRQTGAYHVLIVAGLHVGVLVFVLLWLGRKLRLPLPTRTLFTLALLAGYVAIVQDRPPILRAALMATVYLLARLLFRRTALLNAIGVAALLILLVRPSEVLDPSFQLSFLAAGIIGGIAAPWLERTAERYRRALSHLGDATRDGAHAPNVAQFRLDARAASAWLGARLPQRLSRFAAGAIIQPCRAALRAWELIVISVVLQTGMLPLMAQYFHLVSPVGPGANVAAVLLTGLIVPLGFATLGVGMVWRGLGQVLARALGAMISGLIASVGWFSHWTWASRHVPSPPPLVLAAFFAAAVLLAGAVIAAKRWVAAGSGIVVLALALLIAADPFTPRLHRGQLEVTLLDVGQGDSIFVAFPNGKTMLVDGGGLPGSYYVRGVRSGIDVGEDVVSPFLWSRGLKRIDVVALTHAHEDHIGGLAAVLRNFQVGEPWVGRDEESEPYRALLDEAAQRGVPVVHRVRGENFDWQGVHLAVLWPDTNDPARAANNDDSLVMRLDDGAEHLLLTGDIERPVERTLLADADSLRADFLKIPHHGSKTSSTEPFLDAVHPRFAAISVGESNPFGHPNQEVVDRITAEGARLFRTDVDGAVTVLTDGHALEIHGYLDSP